MDMFVAHCVEQRNVDVFSGTKINLVGSLINLQFQFELVGFENNDFTRAQRKLLGMPIIRLNHNMLHILEQVNSRELEKTSLVSSDVIQIHDAKTCN